MPKLTDMLALAKEEFDRSVFFSWLIPKNNKISTAMIPGIVADAERLGVSRFHLWAVLSGRRFSPTLVARYRELKGVKTARAV